MDVIKYAFDTERINNFGCTFNIDNENVQVVHVKSEDNQILVDMEVQNVFDGDDLRVYNEIFINWSVAFSFEFSVPVRNLRQCGYYLPKIGGDRNYQVNAGSIVFSLPKKPLTPSDEQLSNVRQLSLDITKELLVFLRQYAFANAETDPISRYSFLYNLLLQIVGDKQARVDSAILEIDPNCEQTISPNNDKQETIYTKIRNELAHKREGVSYHDTKTSVIEVIDGFSDIVKAIILVEK